MRASATRNVSLLRSISDHEISTILTQPLLHVVVASFGFTAGPRDKKAISACSYISSRSETFVSVEESWNPSQTCIEVLHSEISTIYLSFSNFPWKSSCSMNMLLSPNRFLHGPKQRFPRLRLGRTNSNWILSKALFFVNHFENRSEQTPNTTFQPRSFIFILQLEVTNVIAQCHSWKNFPSAFFSFRAGLQKESIVASILLIVIRKCPSLYAHLPLKFPALFEIII